MNLFQVYVYDANEYESLASAIEASKDLPEHMADIYKGYSFATKEEQLAFVEGVGAVNIMPGPQHFEAVTLTHFNLRIYRGADYDESYSDACRDGAVYNLEVNISIEELKDVELLSSYNRVINRTEKCINHNQSNLQILLVNPLVPTEFHRLEDFL